MSGGLFLSATVPVSTLKPQLNVLQVSAGQKGWDRERIIKVKSVITGSLETGEISPPFYGGSLAGLVLVSPKGTSSPQVELVMDESTEGMAESGGVCGSCFGGWSWR